MHDYVHYYDHERIKLRLLGRSPAEYQIKKHRLNGGIVTVQLLGVSPYPARFTTANSNLMHCR